MGDGGLRQWLGEEAHAALSRWAAQMGFDHRLRRAFDNGGTQAKVGVVERREVERQRSYQLVMKFDRFSGTDFSQTEFTRHRRAAERSREWAAKHLARQSGQPIPVGDEWSITFQHIAGALDEFEPLSSLIRGFHGEGPLWCSGAELAGAFRSVVSGVLSDWAGEPNTAADDCTVPEYLRKIFDYRLRPGKPLLPLVQDSRHAAFQLIQKPALTAGVEVFPLIGKSHGDLHVENVLVHTGPTLVPDDFRLIDLANHQDPGPVARDPAHLLMHMVNLSLRHMGDSQRDALMDALLDPRHPRADILPAWLRSVISEMYEAGERWVEGSGYEAEWRRDRPLALYAASLMVYVRSSTLAEDKPWLLEFATRATDRFLATATRRQGRGPNHSSSDAVSRPTMGEEGEEQFVVGRDTEAAMFHDLLLGRDERYLLNIFGVGGMGKTVVGRKLARQARATGIPVADADVSDFGNDPWAVLRQLSTSLAGSIPFQPLMDFVATVDAHDAVQAVSRSMGGVDAMFETIGTPKDGEAMRVALDACDPPLPRAAKEVFSSRFALERFLRSSDQTLAAGFGDMLGAALDGSSGALILDTYEEVGALDRWVRRSLIPALPPTARVVILGRNSLPRQTLDWTDLADTIKEWPLPELSEDDAAAYLRHYGLTDLQTLERIRRFTGGYPLLLMLVRRLAWQAGGWQAIGDMEHSADRDEIAGKLLERILREERVHDVRDVLEKCCVATWVNPEIISELLDVDKPEGRTLFDKVRQHSFMERHPEGARLHDKIRELLQERLRFTDQAEYDRLQAKLLAYHAKKSQGLGPGHE